MAGGLAGGLAVAAGAPGGRAPPHGTGSQGLWCAGGGGLRERKGRASETCPGHQLSLACLCGVSWVPPLRGQAWAVPPSAPCGRRVGQPFTPFLPAPAPGPGWKVLPGGGCTAPGSPKHLSGLLLPRASGRSLPRPPSEVLGQHPASGSPSPRPPGTSPPACKGRPGSLCSPGGIPEMFLVR